MSSGGSSSGDEYLCPICLQKVADAGYVDPCYHQFCFACICQWIEFRPQCPLCNGKVDTIVKQTSSGGVAKLVVVSGAAREPHRAQNASSSRNSRRRCNASYGRSQAITQADEELGMRKRTAVYAHSLHRVDTPPLAESSRRTRISQTPNALKREIGSERCREWIRRDLRVVLGVGDVEFFVSVVVSAVRDLGSLEMSDVGEMVGSVLEDKAGVFLRELAAFVDSPLSMAMYDRYVAYSTTQPTSAADDL
ncbi:hypothetical protein GQ54DRAFT_259053 [Martensiomyces pterosporus]|nr:hypothetical protein GQ54DRAFT_259053 [Martensiomyces pterosporus]